MKFRVRSTYSRKHTDVLVVVNHDKHTEFHGAPHLLQRVVVGVQDHVWPKWRIDDKKGVVNGYLEDCKCGCISLSHDHYLSVSWERVQKKLDADGTGIVVSQEEIK